MFDNLDRAFQDLRAPQDPALRERMGRLATPLIIEPETTDGAWNGVCALKYDGSIFRSEFSLDEKDGVVRHTVTSIEKKVPLSRELFRRGLYTVIARPDAAASGAMKGSMRSRGEGSDDGRRTAKRVRKSAPTSPASQAIAIFPADREAGAEFAWVREDASRRAWDVVV